MRLQMKTKVSKRDLLEKVRKAREQHKAQYEEALKGWIKMMDDAAKKVISRIQKDNLHAFPSEFRELMHMPSLHIDDYDHAIAMLEMSVDDEIELEPDDFDQLVLGNWSWKEEWVHTNLRYSK